MFRDYFKKKQDKVSFEQQLEIFKGLGFTLNNGVEISDIDRCSEGKVAFEVDPFELMYTILGQTLEREPWTPLTNQIWYFDTEAIQDNGCYVDILQNLSRISNNELAFENLEDLIDFEKEECWVSFTLRGVSYKWDLELNDDWVDPKLFDKVKDLTDKLQTKGRFTVLTFGTQEIIFGYCIPEQLKEIKKATGLNITWL